MIAISSHRPLSQCSEEIKRNQLLAKRSWEMCFKKIIYFGPSEHELVSGKTAFVQSTDFPRIKDLAMMAGGQVGFVAILNADIVVNPDIRKLERMMSLRGKLCASSRRYDFDANTCDFKAAQLGDARGRDIFIARNDIWREFARHVPEALRLGAGRWDAYCVDYFRARHDAAFIDFTDMRVCFHPIHGDRIRLYEEEIAKLSFEIPRR